MLKIIAILFGVAFIFVGVAGFLPNFRENNLLFGIFEVDTIHNLVHLISGILAIMASTRFVYAQWYFKIFGIIYLLVALCGFILKGDFYFLMMHMNTADNFLHLGIGLVSIFLGFFFHKIL